MTRTFRDGRAEGWFAADATLGWWGPAGFTRLVVATADPRTCRARHLVPGRQLAPAGRPAQPGSAHPAADLAEVARIYGIRHWTGQSYKQVKDELGWADFQVRSDTAIRRHQALVNCAFCFCWAAWFPDHPARADCANQAGTRPRRGRRTALPPPAPSWPRALRAIEHGFPPGSRCSAGGRHGRTGPRPRSCKP